MNNNNSNELKQNDNNDSNDMLDDLKHLDQLVKGCASNDINTNIECCTRIRKLLFVENSPPIDEVVKAGAIPHLVSLLDDKKLATKTSVSTSDNANNNDLANSKLMHQLQYEALWALSNIASSSQHTSILVEKSPGLISRLAQFLLSPDNKVAEQSAWALSNIAGLAPQYLDNILSANGLKNLIQFEKRCLDQLAEMMRQINIKSGNKNIFDWNNEVLLNDDRVKSMLRILSTIAWTLSNFVREKPLNVNFWKDIVLGFQQLLLLSDDKIAADCCWGLYRITKHGNNENKENEENKDNVGVELLHSYGVLGVVINRCLSNKNMAVFKPAIYTIINVTNCNDKQTNYLIESGLLYHLCQLLNCCSNNNNNNNSNNKDDNNVYYIRMACLAISNIAAGTLQQINAIMNCNNLIDIIIGFISCDQIDIKFEAMHVVSNIANNQNLNQILCLVRKGVIKAICHCGHQCQNGMPKNDDHDEKEKNKCSKLIQCTMQTLQNILECGATHKDSLGFQTNPFVDMIEAEGGLNTV